MTDDEVELVEDVGDGGDEEGVEVAGLVHQFYLVGLEVVGSLHSAACCSWDYQILASF